MNYVLLMRQSGEGCDYTIGCGYKWLQFSAEHIEEATARAKQTVRDHGWRGDGVSEALLVPASELVNLGTLLDVEDTQAESDADQATLQQKELADRKAYEELKKKFG